LSSAASWNSFAFIGSKANSDDSTNVVVVTDVDAVVGIDADAVEGIDVDAVEGIDVDAVEGRVALGRDAAAVASGRDAVGRDAAV
jgi:hypothetical protein